MLICLDADTRTGVYAGCMYQEYIQLQQNLGHRLGPASVTGNGISYLVGRLSYTFNLTGPCISTDTACSSSLVSLAQAHASLAAASRQQAALAAGVNAMLLPSTSAAISSLGALSPEARCKTFDATADGYGRGEGFSVAMLATREALLEAAWSGLALVRSAGVNQDGRSGSLTAPNGPSQTALVVGVLRAAALSASSLRLVSLHGTGELLCLKSTAMRAIELLPQLHLSGRVSNMQARRWGTQLR